VAQDSEEVADLKRQLEEKEKALVRLMSALLCPKCDAGHELAECSCDEFFILALDRCQGDDFLCWWRPNNSGYTYFLEAAGRYSREMVEKKASYYNNGETLAIPVKEVFTNAGMVVYKDEWGSEQVMKAEKMAKKNQAEATKRAEEYRKKFYKGICPDCGEALESEDYEIDQVRVFCSDDDCGMESVVNNYSLHKREAL
jgi:hypothetical protein